MRASTVTILATGVGLALACGGGDEPSAPVVPTPPPVTGEAPTAGGAAPVELAWLEVVDGRCLWRQARLPGGTPTTRGDLGPGPCPDAWKLRVEVGDKRALVLADGAPPRVLDLEEHAIYALSDPPMGDVAYAEAGLLVACRWDDGDFTPAADGSPEGTAGKLAFADGATAPYVAEGYEAAYVRQRAYIQKGDGWEQLSEKIVGLPEGVSPPFCELPEGHPVAPAIDLDPRVDDGGFGVFLTVSDDATLPTAPQSGSWYLLPDSTTIAVAGDSFEGTVLNGPTAIRVGAAWKTFPGVGVRVGDWVLVRDGTTSSLVDPLTGEAKWTGPAAAPLPAG